MRAFPAVCLAAGLFAVATLPAAAQSVTRPAFTRMHREGWTFIPVATVNDQVTSVHGVLALRDLAGTIGQNIVAIWYASPQHANGTWTAKAWDSSDPSEAVKYIKNEYAIDDAWDFLWSIAPSSGAPAAPAPFASGAMVGDPIAPWLQTSLRDELVIYLASVGYRIADVPIEKLNTGQLCQKEAVLPSLADAVQFASRHPHASQSEWGAQPFSAVFSSCAVAQTGNPAAPVPPACRPWGCLPGTTTPAPGLPLSQPGLPHWQTDPASAPVVDPSCSTVTTTCWKQDVDYYYHGTCWLGTACILRCQAQTSWTCPGVGVYCPPPVPILAVPGSVLCDRSPGW